MVEEYTNVIKLRNDNQIDLQIYIEPWSLIYELKEGESLVIVATGPKVGFPTLFHGTNMIIYGAWSRSNVTVYKNGHMIDSDLQEPSPITETGAKVAQRYFQKR